MKFVKSDFRPRSAKIYWLEELNHFLATEYNVAEITDYGDKNPQYMYNAICRSLRYSECGKQIRVCRKGDRVYLVRKEPVHDAE